MDACGTPAEMIDPSVGFALCLLSTLLGVQGHCIKELGFAVRGRAGFGHEAASLPVLAGPSVCAQRSADPLV